MMRHIPIPDLNFDGVDTYGLSRLLRELPAVIDALVEITECAPCQRTSQRFSGATENTPIGDVLDSIVWWLKYQEWRTYQALRQTKPDPGEADFRSLDLIRYMGAHAHDLTEIAGAALLLQSHPTTTWRRDDRLPPWASDYLKGRSA